MSRLDPEDWIRVVLKQSKGWYLAVYGLQTLHGVSKRVPSLEREQRFFGHMGNTVAVFRTGLLHARSYLLLYPLFPLCIALVFLLVPAPHQAWYSASFCTHGVGIHCTVSIEAYAVPRPEGSTISPILCSASNTPSSVT